MANVVTTVGMRQALREAANVASATPWYYMAVGTGSAPSPAESSTALQTAVAGHAALTNSVSDNVATLEAFFTNSQGNGTLTEWGIFDSALAMLMYGQFTPSVTKTSAQTLTVTVTVTLENG